MIVELGHFCVMVACLLALLQVALPVIGLKQNNLVLMASATSLAYGVFLFTLLGFLALIYAFVMDDFSVAYVASHSNTRLPLQFKVSALWSAHEGSFLLWTLVMSIWTMMVARFSTPLTADMRARVLICMAALGFGFYLFLLLTSNPFERALPFYPAEGADLNPLLQDFGLIVHPPLLYMGYVGLSVPFAFAIASLWGNNLDVSWARWSRPWTNLAWAFLTMGITLGSWWAYYELGWGGWWFWDAVENASFVPWLIATALVHSLAATEKRGVFKSWTVLLAIFGFSFSLLGAFLVRSGVLTSVHAFAVDPERGAAILAFLVLVIGGSLILYGARAWNLRSRVTFKLSGRESFILGNNLLLSISAAVVLLGTLYPLGYEALTGGDKISIGPPYFNAVFVPLMLPLMGLMILSNRSRWWATDRSLLTASQGIFAVIAVVASVGVAWAAGEIKVWIVVISSLSFMILLNLCHEFYRRVGQKSNPITRLFRQPVALYAMFLGHLGIAVSALGIVTTVMLSEEADLRMAAGDIAEVGAYTVRFYGTTNVDGPNYVADRGRVDVLRAGQAVATLFPEKRRYLASQSVMTEADIHVRMLGDIYVALGEPLESGAWAVRVHIKPLVRFIWIGGVLIALGGVISIFDRRYRLNVSRRVRQSSVATNQEPVHG